MRIQSIHLQKVGPFEDQKIVFPEKPLPGAEIHILVGENGSGKSTAIHGLASHFGASPPAARAAEKQIPISKPF